MKSLPQVLEVFARQVLNLKSRLVANKKVVESCKMFIKAMGASLSYRTAAIWEVPTGLHPVQTFALHFMHFAATMYTNAALYKKCQHICLSRSS